MKTGEQKKMKKQKNYDDDGNRGWRTKVNRRRFNAEGRRKEVWGRSMAEGASKTAERESRKVREGMGEEDGGRRKAKEKEEGVG